MASKVLLPKLTYEMEEGRILQWLSKEGDRVSVGQTLFVVETDKAAIEVPAELEGTLLKVLVPAGETVPIASLLGWIGKVNETLPSGEEPRPQSTAVRAAPQERAPLDSREPEDIIASPIARRMARELGIDLRDVQAHLGTKRIREADVQAFAKVAGRTAGPSALPASGTPDSELVQPTPFQRAMASHLAQAASIPHLAVECEVELTRLRLLRDQLAANWSAAHVFPLTLTPILAALAAKALGAGSLLNASWTNEGIRLYQDVNLGVAMASDRGLVVPVVRNANRLSLSDMAAEIARLREAASANRLQPADLEGGTFTITNMGMLGVTRLTPVISPPQSAILGIGAAQTRLTLDEGNLKQVEFCAVTLAADHRLVDGAQSAVFLRRFKELAEDPEALLGS